MKIKHKYLRNRAYRVKHWNHIRRKSHPYETFCPYRIDVAPSAYWVRQWNTEDQVKRHFEWIAELARALENGHKNGLFHAPKDYRKTFNDRIKAKERNAMAKIR